MLKKKLCKILAAVMVATTVLGSNVKVVNATEIDNGVIVDAISSSSTQTPGGGTTETPDKEDSENENEGNVLADGIYSIGNKILQTGTDKNSTMRNYVDATSIVTVKDGKITVTMKYNEAGVEAVRTTNSITVNGEKVEFVNNEDGSISFDIDSKEVLFTRVIVNLTYHHESLPEHVFPGKVHTVNVDLLHEGDLTEYKGDDSSNDSDNNEDINKPGDENNSGSNDGNTGDNNGGNTGNQGSNGDSNNGTVQQETKVYIGKIQLVHDNETGLAMAKKAVEETIKVEDVNGKKYITITFTEMGSTDMANHKIYVNGKEVEATKVTKSSNLKLRFAVGSLQDDIKISATVAMMGGRTVEFGAEVLEETLTLVTDGATNGGTTEGSTEGTIEGTTGGTTTGSNNNGNTSNDTTTTTEEKVEVIKGKLYSIQNSVTHENETGREMARKYLNASSKVEEIDGKYYVTLTFTGADFMQNHEVYVNGVRASVSRITSGDTTNVRFAVSSLSDSIKVSTYVVPMGREVEFGVELLEDTLTFIKEYTVDTLAETGAPIASTAVAGLGMLLTSAGFVLAKKRK